MTYLFRTLCRPLSLWLGLFFVPQVHALEPISTVDDLLRQLSQSLQERSFRGHLTYEYSGRLESLALVHGINNGVEQEKIVHLSGPMRAAVRNGRSINCVSAGSFLLRGGLANQGTAAIGVNQSYQFILRGEERIAGRQAAIIQLVPKDNYRYGLSLALDKDTGLPLMWMVQNAQRQVLERMKFVDIQYDPKFNESDFFADGSTVGVNVGKEQCFAEAVRSSRWQLSWLPPGFILAQAIKEGDGEFLTFTDGLAVFSVRITQTSGLTRAGAVMRGATLAFVSGVTIDENPLQLSLTGEIPFETAKAVLASVRRADAK